MRRGELVSLSKSALTHYVGMLPPRKLRLLDKSLRIALQIEERNPNQNEPQIAGG